jgi:hypothetical protein
MPKKISQEEIQNLILKEIRSFNILSGYQMLNESSMSRVLGEYFNLGFIIITGDRSCWAEQGGRDCSPEEEKEQAEKNKKNEKLIRQDIKNAGFGFVPTYGGFKEKIMHDGMVCYLDNPHPEKSFIIPAKKIASEHPRADYESLRKLGVELCIKYNQDSFLYKPPQKVDKSAYFIDKHDKVESTFSNVKVDDIAQQYFTALRKDANKIGNGGTEPDKAKDKRRFSLLESKSSEGKWYFFIPKSPRDTSEARSRYGEFFFKIL